MLNTSETADLNAHAKAARAVRQTHSSSPNAAPKTILSRAITTMMTHGGVYSLIDPAIMNARFAAVAATMPDLLGPSTTATAFTAAVSA